MLNKKKKTVMSERKRYVTLASKVNIQCNITVSQGRSGSSCVCADANKQDRSYQLFKTPKQVACLNEEYFDYFA